MNGGKISHCFSVSSGSEKISARAANFLLFQPQSEEETFFFIVKETHNFIWPQPCKTYYCLMYLTVVSLNGNNQIKLYYVVV